MTVLADLQRGPDFGTVLWLGALCLVGIPVTFMCLVLAVLAWTDRRQRRGIRVTSHRATRALRWVWAQTDRHTRPAADEDVRAEWR